MAGIDKTKLENSKEVILGMDDKGQDQNKNHDKNLDLVQNEDDHSMQDSQKLADHTYSYGEADTGDLHRGNIHVEDTSLPYSYGQPNTGSIQPDEQAFTGSIQPDGQAYTGGIEANKSSQQLGAYGQSDVYQGISAEQTAGAGQSNTYPQYEGSSAEQTNTYPQEQPNAYQQYQNFDTQQADRDPQAGMYQQYQDTGAEQPNVYPQYQGTGAEQPNVYPQYRGTGAEQSNVYPQYQNIDTQQADRNPQDMYQQSQDTGAGQPNAYQQYQDTGAGQPNVYQQYQDTGAGQPNAYQQYQGADYQQPNAYQQYQGQGPWQQGAYQQAGYQQPKEDPFQKAGAYQPYGQYQRAGNTSGNGFGIASMILGILSLMLFCTCINIPLAIAAVIFGILHLSRSANGRGIAITGIVTAILSVIALIVTFVLMWGPFMAYYSEELMDNVRPGYDYDAPYNFDDYDDIFEFFQNYDMDDYHTPRNRKQPDVTFHR